MLGGLTTPARPSSTGRGNGAGYHQGVETSWTFTSAQEGAHKKTKSPEYTNRQGGTRAGEEETRLREVGGQGLETQLSLGPAWIGPQVNTGRRGGGFEGIAE